MTNKELQELLKTYPEDLDIKTEFEGEFFEIRKSLIRIENNSETSYEDIIVIW